jgi:hypothetical protein
LKDGFLIYVEASLCYRNLLLHEAGYLKVADFGLGKASRCL